MRSWSTFAIAALLLVAVLMTHGPALPSQAAQLDTSTFLPLVERAVPTDDSADQTYEPPINVFVTLHVDPPEADPITHLIQPTDADYQRAKDEIIWLTAEAAEHGARLTLLSNGWYMKEVLERGDYEHLQALLDAGHEIGTHAHSIVYDPAVDAWRQAATCRLNPDCYNRAVTEQVWRDAFRFTDAVLAEMGAEGQNRTMCAVPFLGSDEGQLMELFGFDIASANRSEQGVRFFGHTVWNPWRVAQSDDPARVIDEDLSTGYVSLDHYAQIGRSRAHGMDLTLPQLKKHFLTLYIEWLARERTGAPDKVWSFGFNIHPNYGASYNADIEAFLDWLDANFIGQVTARGHTIARYATESQIADEFLAWEAAHPGQSSFAYVAGDPYPYTYAVVPQLLAEAAYVGQVDLGPWVSAFELTKSGRPLYALWSNLGRRTVDLSAILPGDLAVTTAEGDAYIADARRLTLTEVPIFVEPLPAAPTATQTATPTATPTVTPTPGDSVVTPVDQSVYYQGTDDECWTMADLAHSTQTDFAESIGPDVGSPDTPLYFTIAVHVEPHQSYAADPARYDTDARRLRRFADLVAAHGGRLTVQVQSPFTQVAERRGDTILADLAAQGHEVALHFHEDAHLPNANDRPVEDWIAAFDAETALIEELAGTEQVRTWSGGNLYEGVFDAAAAAGMDVNTNYKNPRTQFIDAGYLVTNPWRPAGGGEDERLLHDPDGSVAYLPSGVYPAHCPRSEAFARPYNYQAFDFTTVALRNSLDAATPGKVNVFYGTMHPGDFGPPFDDEGEFHAWDQWLTRVVDPLVADGRLVWATAGEVADAFNEWCSARPFCSGGSPSPTATPTASPTPTSSPSPTATPTASPSPTPSPSPTATPSEYQVRVVEAWVTAPNGNRLYTRVAQPDPALYPGQRFPAVVVIPGGLGDGAPQISRPEYRALAAEGFVVVGFNPEGRGDGRPGNLRSQGQDDCNGFVHQDDLKAVIEYVAGLPNVDPANIGVESFSFGVAIAAGALGRYPDLPVAYYIDGEGPHDNRVVTHYDVGREHDLCGHWSTVTDPSSANVAWWREREAVNWIGGFRGYFMRVQAEVDHAQGPRYFRHAIEMINAATEGAAAWTRMNGAAEGNPVNVTYPLSDPSGWPTWVPGRIADHPGLMIGYIKEMARLVAEEANSPATSQ